MEKIIVLSINKDCFIDKENVKQYYDIFVTLNEHDMRITLHNIEKYESCMYKEIEMSDEMKGCYETIFDVYDETIEYRLGKSIETIVAYILCIDNKYIGHVYTWQTSKTHKYPFHKEDVTFVEAIRKSIFSLEHKGVAYKLISYIVNHCSTSKIYVCEPVCTMKYILDKIGFVEADKYWGYNKKRLFI